MNFRYLHTTFTVCLLAANLAVFSQRTTGINNTSPSTKAALDVQTTTGFKQGILVPRLNVTDTTTLKSSITSSEKGLLFFDTDNNYYWFWNGTKWVAIGNSTSSSPWTSSGSNIYPTTLTNKVGLGTTSPDVTLSVKGHLRMNDSTIYFRTSGDANHGLRYAGSFAGNFVDGPLLYGFNGGTLGTPTKSILTWRSSGNVGIGTTSPLTSLHVITSSNGGALITGVGARLGLGESISGNDAFVNPVWFIDNYSDQFRIFRQTTLFGSGSTMLYVTNTGKIGIGTNIPSEKLTVSDGNIAISRADGVNPELTISGDINGFGYSLYMDDVGDANFHVEYKSLAQRGLTVSQSNYVGIGTVSPAYLLDVNGDAYIKPGVLGSKPYKGTSWFSIQHSSLPFNDVSYGFAQSKAGYVMLNTPTNVGTNFIDFRVNDVSQMRMSENGNFSIGTTTEAGRLYVYNSTTSTQAYGLQIDHLYAGASVKYGIDNNVSADGTGSRYGFRNLVYGNASSGTNYGIYNQVDPQSASTAYGMYNYVMATGTGTRYGIRNYTYAAASNTSAVYSIYNTISNSGTGTSYGIYQTGEDLNYFSGTLQVAGYTKLGSTSSSPSIKVVTFRGTTPASGSSSVAIDLSSVIPVASVDKVLCISTLVRVNSISSMPPDFTGLGGYEYSFFYRNDPYLFVYTNANSANTLSKPIDITITYQE